MGTEKAMDMFLTAHKFFPAPTNKRWTEYWDSHVPLVRRELEESAPEDQKRTMRVLVRNMREPMPDLGGEIDWDKELSEFQELPYPSYYLFPFHSVLGGWLSVVAAL